MEVGREGKGSNETRAPPTPFWILRRPSTKIIPSREREIKGAKERETIERASKIRVSSHLSYPPSRRIEIARRVSINSISI